MHGAKAWICASNTPCLHQLQAFPDRAAFPTRLPQLYKEICGLLAAGNKTALRQLVRAALDMWPELCIAMGLQGSEIEVEQRPGHALSIALRAGAQQHCTLTSSRRLKSSLPSIDSLSAQPSFITAGHPRSLLRHEAAAEAARGRRLGARAVGHCAGERAGRSAVNVAWHPKGGWCSGAFVGGEPQTYKRRVARHEEVLGMPAGSDGGHVGDGECTHTMRLCAQRPAYALTAFECRLPCRSRRLMS